MIPHHLARWCGKGRAIGTRKECARQKVIKDGMAGWLNGAKVCVVCGRSIKDINVK